jgi:hypothetical protein
MIQDTAMTAMNMGASFREAALASESITGVLSAADIEAACDLSRHFANERLVLYRLGLA